MGDEVTSRRQEKRVAIFAYFNWVGVSSPILAAVQLLIEAGYTVDLFTVKQRKGSEIGLDLPRLNIFEIPFYSPRRFLLLGLACFVASVLHRCGGKSYLCLLGIDPAGLIVATAVAKRTRSPVAYFSLEMLVWQDIRMERRLVVALQKRGVKMLERRCHQQVAFTIALDERRAKCLLEDNRVPGAEVILVPVSPAGEVPDNIMQSDYLRQRFNIPPDKRIILMIGAITDLNMALELAQAARNWPSGWALVLHGWVANEDYLHQVKQACRDRQTILSLDVVPQQELDKLVASADIGIALYENQGLNIYHMSSGKIPQYMRCGLPVIAIDFPNLVDQVEASGCGICVRNEREVSEAIRQILDDYSYYSKNARRVYVERYDFSSHFRQVLDRIVQLGEISSL